MVNKRSARKDRVCSWCAQSFSKDEHLARHIRSHTKEKPFTCPTCGKTFSRHDSVLRHSRSHLEAEQQQQEPSRSQENSVQEDLSNPPNYSLGSECSKTHSNAGLSTSSLGQSSPSARSFGVNNPLSYDYSTLGLGAMSTSVGAGLPRLIDESDPRGVTADSNNLELSRVADIGGANSWVISPNQQLPGWVVDDDFDLSVLTEGIPSSGIPLDSMDWSGHHIESNNNNNVVVQTSTDIIAEHKEENIKRRWFTYLRTETSGQVTPDVTDESTNVDERYRENLSREFQQQYKHSEPLPSTDFLNLCIQMYFTRFHPRFPIVHAPTFRPSAKRSLLLISICSVGSLFLGSSFAVAQGVRLFERLNKLILASWELYFVRGAPDALAMTQAALIGQTFAMLSGNPRHLVLVQTFHGTLIAWARRLNIFRQKPVNDGHTGLGAPDVEVSWRRWIQSEEKRRVAIGLRIHDAELAELFMTEPFLQSSASKTSNIASDDLWNAPTSSAWAHALEESSHQNSISTDFRSANFTRQSTAEENIVESHSYPMFALYASLEGKVSQIMETSSTGQSFKEKSDAITSYLISLYNDRLRHVQMDSFSLKALWHSIFVTMYCNMDKMECALGREGFEMAEENHEYATVWASSMNAHRCAIHAALILRHLQLMPIGQEPAIHVPRLLYRASLVWYAYTRFGRDDDRHGSSSAIVLDFPELVYTGIDGARVLFVANGFKKARPTTPESSTLFHLIDLLARLGHWGISQKMASLFSVLIHES